MLRSQESSCYSPKRVRWPESPLSNVGRWQDLRKDGADYSAVAVHRVVGSLGQMASRSFLAACSGGTEFTANPPTVSRADPSGVISICQW